MMGVLSQRSCCYCVRRRKTCFEKLWKTRAQSGSALLGLLTTTGKMSSVVFLFLNRVPRPKFEGSLTDLKLSNHGEAKEFTTTKGVFCFLCNLKFRNVLIIVQVKPVGLSCEKKSFFAVVLIILGS